MERTSTKHGPRTDDALSHETESLTRGAPVEARAEESRMAEPAGDDDFLASAVLHSLDPPIMGMPADEVSARSMLAIALRPGAFPADAPSLLRDAIANDAPEWVCETLRKVDQVQRYENVQRLWEAAGGHHELRTLHHEAAAAALAEAERDDAPVLERARRAVTREMAQAEPPVVESSIESEPPEQLQPDDSYLGVVCSFVGASWKLTARTIGLLASPLARLRPNRG
ncbi:MAG TPA: hypothetical protein VGO03_11640 [Acidimicrobiia bacterium]